MGPTVNNSPRVLETCFETHTIEALDVKISQAASSHVYLDLGCEKPHCRSISTYTITLSLYTTLSFSLLMRETKFILVPSALEWGNLKTSLLVLFSTDVIGIYSFHFSLLPDTMKCCFSIFHFILWTFVAYNKICYETCGGLWKTIFVLISWLLAIKMCFIF